MSSYLYDRSRRGLSLITPPTNEPVSLTQAKRHLRLETYDDDDYISGLLMPTARQWVESYVRRALYKQVWELTLDRFPSWGDTDDPYFWLYRRGIFELTVPPVMSVDSLTYIDTNGAQQTIDSSFFNVDIQDDYVRFEPVYGQFWPVTQFRIATVKIRYTAGYTDGIQVSNPPEGYTPPDGVPDPRLPQDGDPLRKIPAPMKQAILLLLGHLYENREEVVIGKGVSQLPFGIESLLGPYRSIKF